MIGSPGAGKSMLAARLPSILPPLSPSELLEVSMIASVAGEIRDGTLTARRPFRAPHHSASMAAAPSMCRRGRSEEHTSELQSLRHLVCRLLLEKKKQSSYNQT